MSAFTELHDDLRRVARAQLAGVDGPVPTPLLVDAGWLGLEVPEELRGAGATFAEVAVVLEELGRAAATSSYLGSVLAIGALLAIEPGPERDGLLRRSVTGETRLALALEPEFVPDAVGADHVLVLTDDGVLVGSPEVIEQPVLDVTRSLARVTGADGEHWRFVEDGAAQRLRDRAALVVAIDSLGLAEAMLDATVAYAKERHQFGQPIGSFQAVKHACADMTVQVALSRELIRAAVAGGSTEASMAKAFVTEAAVEVAGKAIQLHGGIGYTWESGLHAYLKRATLNRALFGTPAEHRRRIAKRYETLMVAGSAGSKS